MIRHRSFCGIHLYTNILSNFLSENNLNPYLICFTASLSLSTPENPKNTFPKEKGHFIKAF